MEEEQVKNSMESLIKEMGEKLSIPAMPPATEAAPACLISWVDDQIRAADPEEYKPYQVLIGPFYRDKSHWMEKEKKNLLHSALPSDDKQRREQDLRLYLETMEALEGRARWCYDRTFRMTRDEFACMLLLDGYFLLSCFVPITGSTSRVSDGYNRDVIFLLENQVPFFILEEIYRMVVPETEYKDSFVVQNIAWHIEKLVHRLGYVHSTVTFNLERPRPCHLLHLLYTYFQPTGLHQHRRSSAGAETNGSVTEVQLTHETNSPMINNASTNGSTQDTATVVPSTRWRAATHYYAAGVRLAKRELDSNAARSILDVKLKDGTLHVPCLVIDGNTWTILRNMVALEQHNPSIGSHVAAYCLFMSQVASTEEDVTLLLNKGIVVHFLSKDSDVADGFANLCRGVFVSVNNPDSNYLVPIQEELEELCRSRWGKSMAWLRHYKCNNFFMTLAVVAAVILFVCTLEQSIFAALSYVKGKP